MVNLTVNYLGLRLKNPIIIASSPLGEKMETIQLLEQKGASAVVLPSLFEEQAELEEKSHFLLYEENGYSKYLDYYQDFRISYCLLNLFLIRLPQNQII